MAAAPKSPTANRANLFGTFFHDQNHQVGSGYPNYPYYQDASATPVQSPIALTTTAVPLTIPGAAISITIISATAFRVSDQPALATTKPYAAFPANTQVTIPLVTPSNDPLDPSGLLYLASDTLAGATSFFFSCV